MTDPTAIKFPQVDVLMPVYGVERFIEKSLTSVLDQDYPCLRILIIDDASPDRSMELAEKIIREKNKHNHSIDIIRKEKNEGLGSVRALHYQHLKGKYAIVLDSDDYWDNEHVISEWVAIAEAGNYDVVISDYCHEYPLSGEIIPMHIEPYESGRDFALAILNATEESFLWNKLIRSELLSRYQHLAKKGRNYWEDIAIVVPLISHASRIGFYPKTTVHYLHHGKQYTAGTKPEYIPTVEDILVDLGRELDISEDEAMCQAYNYFILHSLCVLRDNPYKYFKGFLHPAFKIANRHLLPSGAHVSKLYFRHRLTTNKKTMFLGYLWQRISRFIFSLKRKKNYYKA